MNTPDHSLLRTILSPIVETEFGTALPDFSLADDRKRLRSLLLPALHAVQLNYGFVPEAAAVEISHSLGIPLAEIHGVIEFYTMFRTQPSKMPVITICTDPICAAHGSKEMVSRLCKENLLPDHTENLDGQEQTIVEPSTCLGLCNRPVAANLVSSNHRLVQIAPLTIEQHAIGEDHRQGDFIGGGLRKITALCGERDVNGPRPASISKYIASGGFQGLQKIIKTAWTSEMVIDEIKRSGLVGMGGAAFPTGIKWEGAFQALGQPKYFVINADESEPGTFKDRILLEGDPLRVIEGALIGAYAIRAVRIYFFIRGEYPAALHSVQNAVCEWNSYAEANENQPPHGYQWPRIEIRSGAGAYICGEETALFESIEGKRGFPRIKPPFPTTFGLFGKPTVINNVETLAKVPWILAEGADTFRAIGTEKSPGTKLFCLSGDVAQPGLYEVPFGTRLADMIDLAGGATGGPPGYVLLGGAAGNFIAPKEFDIPLTFEDLRSAGLSLGSGVIMVFNQYRDLRKILLDIGHFFAHESCGKCFPCQLGTQRQLEVLERIAMREALFDDIERLQDIGATMTDSSLCGLGQTAATAVSSAIKRWPELFIPALYGQNSATSGRDDD